MLQVETRSTDKGQAEGALDNRASSALTRERFDWQPVQAGLIQDLDKGHYFDR